MFKVETRDLERLYDLLQSGARGIIGAMPFTQEPLSKIETYVYIENNILTIKSPLYPTDEYESEELPDDLWVPHATLKRTLPKSYAIQTKADQQMILHKSGIEYCLEWLGHDMEGVLEIEARQRDTSKESFIRTLNDYSAVLEKTVRALYKECKTTAPNVVYFLGKNPILIRTAPGTPSTEPPSFEHHGPDTEPQEVTAHTLEKRIEIADPAISFDDIGGCAEGKQEMMRIYEDITHPERARYFGRDPETRKGYILTGESGCGKTMLVKALATKLKKDLQGKVKFYAASYDTITSIWRGGEAQATAQLFELAKKNEKKGLKTLIFLDEIHVVGHRQREYNEALDTLLAHLAGMRNYTGLTFIGATYMPLDGLDPALVRRLDRHIPIGKPDATTRAEIFRIHIDERRRIAAGAGNMSLFGDLDYAKLAQASDGLNGSHIERIVRAAVDRKEDSLRTSAGAQPSTEDLLRSFTPITTDEIIAAIKTVPREGASGTMGFRKSQQ